jgi:hypothetical protein
MFHAVTLALVIGGAMGALVLMVHLRNERTGRWLQLERVRSTVRSATHWAAQHQALDGPPVSRPLFEGTSDTVTMVRIAFGMLDLIRVSAQVQGRVVHEAVLAGGAFPTDHVLELDGRAGPLQLAGDARLIGNVRVPGADVRRGYIEGRPYSGSTLVEGSVQRQEGRLSIVGEADRRRAARFSGTDPVGQPIPFDEALEAGRMLRTADANVPVIKLHGPHTWDSSTALGPVVLQCDDTLTIAANAQMQHCLVRAPFIRFSQGFHGSVQAFATQGIDLEADVVLAYPSLLAVVRDPHRDDAAFVTIGNGAHVQGGVLLLDEAVRGRSGASLRIDPDAIVEGEVLVEGSIQHHGLIRGILKTQEFLIRTASSIYRGYLMDGRLEPWPEANGWAFGASALHTERRSIAVL